MNQKAKGVFEVTMTPQTTDTGNGADLARMILKKTYGGDLAGTAEGEILTARTKTRGSAGYVAMERVVGTLHGKTGSFVLQHSGIMDRGAQRLRVDIVPDSGTDELEGIQGTLEIDITDGKHFYALEYSLPE